MTISLSRSFALVLFGASFVAPLSAQKQQASAAAPAPTSNRLPAFERGLSPNPIVINSVPEQALSGVRLTWNAYPGPANDPTEYRVLRAASSSGPWVIVAKLGATSVDLQHQPPATTVYYRVVAVRARTVAVDTTLTVGVAMPAIPIKTATHVVVCNQSGTRSTIFWNSGVGALSYVVTPKMVSGNALTDQPPITTSDTSLVYNATVSNRFMFAVRAHYEVADWPKAGQTLVVMGQAFVGTGQPPVQAGSCLWREATAGA